MPSGAKKRKALKKKKEQEAIGTSTNTKGYNGDNLHGHSEHGSQDERDSDGNLSSPGSHENKEFEKGDPSAALSAGLVKGTDKEIGEGADVVQGLGPESGNAIVVERGTSDQKNVVEKSPNPSSDKEISEGVDVTQGLEVKIGNDTAVERGTNYQETVQEKSSNSSADKEISEGGDGFNGLEPESGNAIAVERENIVAKSPSLSSENCTHTANNEAGGNSISEIALVDSIKPVVSVSKVVIPEKSEHLVKQNSVKNGENSSPDLVKIEDKVVTHSGSAAETSKEVGNVRESEVPVCSEEKPLLLSRPPVVRTSWLSCCGLFDAVSGSDR